MRELKTKDVVAQVEKLRPVAGGIQLRLPKRTGRLIIRQMLPGGRRRAISQTMIGAMKPSRKAQTSGAYNLPGPKKREGPTTPQRTEPLKL